MLYIDGAEDADTDGIDGPVRRLEYSLDLGGGRVDDGTAVEGVGCGGRASIHHDAIGRDHGGADLGSPEVYGDDREVVAVSGPEPGGEDGHRCVRFAR